MVHFSDGSQGGYTEDGQLIGVGGGGFATIATATGQPGMYAFDQTPSEGGKMEASVAAGGFIDLRSGSFANDGVPTVDSRGTEDFEDVLAPGENGYLYMWERDMSSSTSSTEPNADRPWGIGWDGTQFLMTDKEIVGYIYELDSDLNVTGGTTGPGPEPGGVTWDGSEWVVVDDPADYIYTLDTDLSVTGGATTPEPNPKGITWDGSNYFLTTQAGVATYIYELDSNFSTVGGSDPPGGQPQGIEWDGQSFVHTDDQAEYIYVLDSSLSVTGGAQGDSFIAGVGWDGGTVYLPGRTSNHIYEFSGSFDFAAALQE